MPELNPQFVAFQGEIETLLKELTNLLKRGNLTKVQLAQIAAEIDFFGVLKGLGFEDLVNKYYNGYDKIIADRLREAQALGVRNLVSVNLESLQLLKDLDTAYLLKRAEAWSYQYKAEILKSLIRGDTVKQTVANLATTVPLTDAQLGTVVNTQLYEFSRAATREVYRNEPDMRYRYIGGVIPTSSDECRWLFENQDEAGYTRDEIDAGIETPYVYPAYPSLGELAGTVKKIYWQGRIPNFNCGHEWQAIGGALAIREKKIKEGTRNIDPESIRRSKL